MTPTTLDGLKAHYLRFTECEDEAQINGYLFTELTDGRIRVQAVYSCDEYEPAPELMGKAAARARYRELLDTEGYEGPAYVAEDLNRLPSHYFPELTEAYMRCRKGCTAPNQSPWKEACAVSWDFRDGKVTYEEALNTYRALAA